jgi:hypothetical protein
MRRIASILAGLALLIGVAAAPASAAVGPPHLAFYVDGPEYSTVGTPTDFSNTGAPASSFNTLYDFGTSQLSVASAAPGDSDYRGGRWMRFHVTINGTLSQPLTSEEEVLQAAQLGLITISSQPDMLFECPVIPT